MNANWTIADVFQGDATLLDWFTAQLENFTPLNVFLGLLLALLCGIVITLVYKVTYRGVLYSPSFSLTLILVCLVTAPVVMAIKSNVYLSMGMVGALSIVRFRTAVKDPLDTAYMFWSITMGILIGANAWAVAFVALIGIGGIMIAISFIRLRSPNGYLLVLHYDEESQADIEAVLRRDVRYFRMRSKTVTRNGAEMTVEVRLDRRVSIVTDMLDVNGVYDATLVACQTETGA